MEWIKRAIVFWLPTALWMGLIFFLSSFHKIQVTEAGWANFLTRKFAHFVEYAILCVLSYRSFKGTTEFSKPQVLLLAFLWTILYALTDELHQTFINGRSGKLIDVGIDGLGAVIGLLFLQKLSLLPEKIKKLIEP